MSLFNIFSWFKKDNDDEDYRPFSSKLELSTENPYSIEVKSDSDYDLYYVKENGKWTVYHKRKKLFEDTFDDVRYHPIGEMFIVEKDGLCNYLEWDGNYLCEIWFDKKEAVE